MRFQKDFWGENQVFGLLRSGFYTQYKIKRRWKKFT